MTAALNSVCDAHGHSDGLPDRDLRGHVLAVALRAAEAAMTAHGYDGEDAAEVLHVALEDVLDYVDAMGRAN